MKAGPVRTLMLRRCGDVALRAPVARRRYYAGTGTVRYAW